MVIDHVGGSNDRLFCFELDSSYESLHLLSQIFITKDHFYIAKNKIKVCIINQFLIDILWNLRVRRS